ncbi:hypothetical protein [Sphingomonas sp.]|uniref:hypothetical protein n=1 Tax=Sphingomonas sp. TaxID=28214 RepID=UPI003B000651
MLFGAEKVGVNPAGASPSRRRFLAEPRLQFTTLGFPREKSWAAKRPTLQQLVNLDAFARAVIDGEEKEAVRLRAAHLIALFRYLPAMVMQAEKVSSPFQDEADVIEALDAAPRRSRKDLANHPSLALTEAFRLIEDRPDLFRCHGLV